MAGDDSGIAYPALLVERKTGLEQIGDTGRSVADYWAWAHSDLNSNAERGKLAEYLVALALGCAGGTSEQWGAYDLVSPEGIKVEVKTSAYLQSWGHEKLSVLRFGIKPTHAEDRETGQFAQEVKRQSDVYVFCVESCTDQAGLDPLDLSQWDFYPLATATLNTEVGDQGSIGLEGLRNLGACRTGFDDLPAAILAQAKLSSPQ